MNNKVIIIGAGFGGLALGIRLQSRGYQVTILEKNAKPGGQAYQLKKNGYTFDMGPSLITAPHIIQNVFRSAGKRMEDYLDLIPLDPFYRIYFHDNSYLDYSGDSGKMKQQMARFNPADAGQYDRFMARTAELYKAVIDEGMGSRPFADWKTMFGFLPRALRLNALLPAHTLVKKYFKDPRHRFTFSFHPLFIGGNPFTSPAVYLMIPYLEKKGGVWFTPGGMYSLVEALTKVFFEMGGILRTDSEVTRISVRNGKANGAVANGRFFEADAVISNADFYHTHKKLLPEESRRKWSGRKLEKTHYSMSAFLLYLGVRKTYPKLLHHTLILSKRYKSLVNDIFNKKILPDDFSMYLHVPTRTDPSMAPPGCESMYVLIPVANLAGNTDWEQKSQHFARRILDFLENDFGLENLQENIEVMEIFTPEDFREQRNNHLGSAWGVEPRITQTAVFRPHNRSEDVKGLYLVGTSTHPGAGVPGVLLTAEATEKVIVEDLEIPHPLPKNIEEVPNEPALIP
ncbi:MAG: phytoene desaturase family protein [Calditrichia bacterium]